MHSQKEHLVGWHKACWDGTRGCSDLSLRVDSQECHCVGFTHSPQWRSLVPLKAACPKQFGDICGGKKNNWERNYFKVEKKKKMTHSFAETTHHNCSTDTINGSLSSDSYVCVCSSLFLTVQAFWLVNDSGEQHCIYGLYLFIAVLPKPRFINLLFFFYFDLTVQLLCNKVFFIPFNH